MLGLYGAILRAAGDSPVLGCNCMGHLGAGLMHLNRTGDDTSGVLWERTRQRGVNTLAFTLPQHGSFFAIDADCVGITGKIDWELNRRWLQLLSESGTAPLRLLDTSRACFLEEQEGEMRAAFRKPPRGIPRCSSGLAGYHLSPAAGSFRQKKRLSAGADAGTVFLEL